jgi:phosphatidylserine/phosphatidylglycerophosphate/cardiolipin synthase-like enzyme
MAARLRTAALAVALAAGVASPRARAGEAAAPGLDLESLAGVRSMGQPPLWKPFAGAYYGRTGEAPRGAGLAAGVYRDLLPSIVGMGASAEVRLGAGPGGAEAGARALADLRGLFLRTGLDWDARRGDVSWLLSVQLPLRRGGIVGRGSHLRADWLPQRDAVSVGLVFPLEPHMGRTRPRRTDVDLPRPAPLDLPAPDHQGLEDAVARMRGAAFWVLELSSVFFDDHRDDRLKSLERTRVEVRQWQERLAARERLRGPAGAGALAAEAALFHRQLARAFGLAAGGDEGSAARLGEPLAARARAVMLDEVVLPYNRLFGQYKLEDSLLGLGARARERFAARLGARVLPVFESYLGVLEEVRRRALEREEGDGRPVFVPFPLVLLPGQHETQADLDALVGRSAGSAFSRGNAPLYINGQQFQRELRRTIHEAESYHVLWLHDYDGLNGGGQVDSVGLHQAVDGYLAALTRRVLELDRTSALPLYLLLVDLHYYEKNRGRLLLDLLEDPLGHRVRFPRGSEWARRRVEAAQEELRRAVAGSRRLQEGARRHGPGWVRKTVKVHVSVTNPADFSFRTSRLVGYLPIAPDTAMRDHRKIAFRDVTEEDPARGEALLGGAAVGEQYTTATWEDRAILAAGPALVALKDGARRYLLANGFREDQVPPPLRPRPAAADQEERLAALEAAGWSAQALLVHNERGFARKDASAAYLALYSLMPRDSLLVVPDSIWASHSWAGLLVAAALRGCHVYVIAPSLDNAPSAGFIQMSRSREVFTRFVELAGMLGPQIEAAGGRLKVGLYTRRAAVNDLPAKLRETADTYRRHPFLREEFPIPAALYERLDRAPAELEATGFAPEPLPADVRERVPKLHRKTRFFLDRDAILALAARPEVAEALLAQLEARTSVTTDPEGLAVPNSRRFTPLLPLLEAWRSLPDATRERAIAYMTVGSLNKDARGMMLDGEVAYVVSGEWSLQGYLDAFFLLGTTTWVETQEEVDRLLPPYPQWQRRIGRWLRKAV